MAAVIVSEWWWEPRLEEFASEAEAVASWRRRRGNRLARVLFVERDDAMAVSRRWGAVRALRRLVKWYHLKLHEEPHRARYDWLSPRKPRRVVDSADDRSALLAFELKDGGLLRRRRFASEDEARAALLRLEATSSAVVFLEEEDDADSTPLRQVVASVGAPRRVAALKRSVDRCDALTADQLAGDFEITAEEDECRIVFSSKGGLVLRTCGASDAASDVVDGLRASGSAFDGADYDVLPSLEEEGDVEEEPSLAELAASYDQPLQPDTSRPLPTFAPTVSDDDEGEDGLDDDARDSNSVSSAPLAVCVRARVCGLRDEGTCSVRVAVPDSSYYHEREEAEPPTASLNEAFVSAHVVLTDTARLVFSVHNVEDVGQREPRSLKQSSLEAYAVLEVKAAPFAGALELVTSDNVKVGESATVSVTVCAVPLDAALAALLDARPAAVIAVEQRRVVKGSAATTPGSFFANCGGFCAEPRSSETWEPRGYYAPKDATTALALPVAERLRDDFDDVVAEAEHEIEPWRLCGAANTDEAGWQYAAHLATTTWHARPNDAHTVRRRCWQRVVSDETPSDALDGIAVSHVLANAAFFTQATATKSFHSCWGTTRERRHLFALTDADADSLLAAYHKHRHARLSFTSPYRTGDVSIDVPVEVSPGAEADDSRVSFTSPYRLRDDAVDVPPEVHNPRKLSLLSSLSAAAAE